MPTGKAKAEYKAPYSVASFWLGADFPCRFWPTNDKARYTGPFNAHTANRMLIVSTRYDAATPYYGALEVRNHHANSRLITVEGAGHVAQGLSECAEDYASEYLVSGKLPKQDISCAKDLPAFIPSKGISEQESIVLKKRQQKRAQLMRHVLKR